jgi:hypothetical protein
VCTKRHHCVQNFTFFGLQKGKKKYMVKIEGLKNGCRIRGFI